jgi:DNA-binding NtrC family response regulator
VTGKNVKPLVLIVDDEPDIREILSEQLAHTYRTATASNGIEALEVFRREKPDAVLLDINMPMMDGIVAQREMHKIDRTVPVLMLTAIQDVDQLATALKGGAFGYLPKPFDLRYITHLLAAAIPSSGPGGPRRPPR